MRKIHECAEDIKNILNDAERTEEVDGDMLCSINELVDEILSIYCLEKQQRKMGCICRLVGWTSIRNLYRSAR